MLWFLETLISSTFIFMAKKYLNFMLIKGASSGFVVVVVLGEFFLNRKKYL